MTIVFKQYTKSELERIISKIRIEFFRGLIIQEKTVQNAARHAGYNYESLRQAMIKAGIPTSGKESFRQDYFTESDSITVSFR